jgi:hypothetical protein
MKNIFILVLGLTLLFSCDKGKNKGDIKLPQLHKTTLKKSKKIKIEIEYLSSKKDVFRLVLNKIKNNNQVINLIMFDSLKKSESIEKLFFELPFEGKPNSISFGLGNTEEKTISIKKIVLSYDQNNFVINENEVNKYFNYNKYASYDKLSKKIITKKIGNSHSPVISLKPSVKKNIYK